ncbi:MAG: hypothetical protein JW829_05560 [Pirellulales bacterium]|nr:hypothetical protein [Pirellulales bacterium]
MYATTILAAALLGFTWGYQPLDDQKMEYIVQLRQHELKVLADGTHEIISEVPPEALPIGRVRILVGDEVLPRKLLTPKPLHIPGEIAEPAAALNPQSDFSPLDWTTNVDTMLGNAAGNFGSAMDGYRSLRRSWRNRYRSEANRWSSVSPPIRPEPADDSSPVTSWGPPLAQPTQGSATDSRDWRSDDAYTPSSPFGNFGTGPLFPPPNHGSHGIGNDVQRFPDSEVDRSDGSNQLHDWPDHSRTSIQDQRSLIGVPPQSERGQGVRFSTSQDATNPLETQGSRLDWSQIAGNVGETDGLDESNDSSDQQKTQPDLESSGKRSPSVEKRNTKATSPDGSMWRAWTLLLGPLAIALAGLNVYQWGIYKSVRRRYLALLRRSSEV